MVRKKNRLVYYMQHTITNVNDKVLGKNATLNQRKKKKGIFSFGVFRNYTAPLYLV